ncbi:hypothetical protein [Armatimonas sp.]|uniref:hypothetical protein n=1 Tax=Armatimonas sp. TaxID=1872638 RepID=UPI0037524E5F
MQQQRGEPKNQHGRRTVAEMVLSWLILLWGILLTIFLIQPCLLALRNGYDDDNIDILLLLFTLHALLCSVGGLAAQFRYRMVARWLLNLAALCLMILSGTLASGNLKSLGFWLPIVVPLLGITTVLLLLAQWLGRQTDL